MIYRIYGWVSKKPANKLCSDKRVLAAGTAEQPGRNVKAKSGLNKAILDQGWYEFRRQLDYKLAWSGGWLIAVPAHNTSRTCPCCGHVSADNRKTQAQFRCVQCGYANNADVVGAINVLRRGEAHLSNEGPDMARLACEVNGAVRPSAAGTCWPSNRFNA